MTNFDWSEAGRCYGKAAYLNGESSWTRREHVEFGYAWDAFVEHEATKGIAVRAENSLTQVCISTFVRNWQHGYNEARSIPRCNRQYPQWENSEFSILHSLPKHSFMFQGTFKERYYFDFASIIVPKPREFSLMDFQNKPIPAYVETHLETEWYFGPTGRFPSGPYATPIEAEQDMYRYAYAIWGLEHETQV